MPGRETRSDAPHVRAADMARPLLLTCSMDEDAESGSPIRHSSKETKMSNEYRTFVVPYDFSEYAKAALYTALDLARHLKADIHLVHVVELSPYPAYGGMAAELALRPPILPGVRENALESLDEVAASIENAPGKILSHVEEDPSIAGSICDAANKLDADLIVMGTHGRTGIAHVFLGSVAERTLRRAPCPVLIVPSKEGGTGESTK